MVKVLNDMFESTAYFSAEELTTVLLVSPLEENHSESVILKEYIAIHLLKLLLQECMPRSILWTYILYKAVAGLQPTRRDCFHDFSFNNVTCV
mgnify:CR=1 FL=1